tara:strand:+ start:262 stop:1146 length:885 start_codon:yes stop_codon:yes gene_type:complete
MDNLDFDIDNYDLDDLLNLYNLRVNFDESDLKNAYKKTLMTHPDKSGLDKKYFLFFCKAYKLLKYLFNFKNTKLQSETDDYEEIKKNTIKKTPTQLRKLLKRDDFNEVFNKLFEQTKIYDEEQDNGYKEWIDANPVRDVNTNIQNSTSLNEYITNAKREAKELVSYNGVKEIDSSIQCGNNSNLMREKQKYYESGLFSKMPYDDYKRAHTETVVPVTDEDFRNRKNFNNINEIKSHRHIQVKNIDYSEQTRILKEKKTNDLKESTNIAYNLFKQMEQAKNSNALFNGKLNLLEG